MKRILFGCAVIIFFSGCNNYYSHIIESDYSYDGNFNRYKTYTFVLNDNSQGSEMHNELIEKYLAQNLQNWGYKAKKKKPNLIVFYTLYTEDLRFTGYKQPNFESWVKWNFTNDIMAVEQDTALSVENFLEDEDRKALNTESYDAVKFALKEGTLLISLYDRRLDKTIWQGYASGVIGNDQFDNDRFIRHIVMRIMDKYRVLAVGTI